MIRLPVLATLVLLAASGCRTSAPDDSVKDIESFGLIESIIDHPSLLDAIHTTQIVLGTTSSIKVVAGWTSPREASTVRVFAATSQGRAENEVMTSYARCRCVVVQVGAVRGWLQRQTGTGQALLAVDIQDVLAYMLLHEVGHIVHNDLLDKDEPAEKTPPEPRFNLDPTRQKAREIAADGYAAEAILAAMAERGTERGTAATKIALTLSQLSWNLAEHRLLDSFGGTALHQPSLFWDAGLSHPNLEWRILSVNDAVSKTAVSHQLLNDFESSRRAEPRVLYQPPRPLN